MARKAEQVALTRADVVNMDRAITDALRKGLEPLGTELPAGDYPLHGRIVLGIDGVLTKGSPSDQAAPFQPNIAAVLAAVLRNCKIEGDILAIVRTAVLSLYRRGSGTNKAYIDHCAAGLEAAKKILQSSKQWPRLPRSGSTKWAGTVKVLDRDGV